MAQPNPQPRETYRGTWAQVLGRKDEIPYSSEVEVRVFDSKPVPDPTIALLESWIAEAPTTQHAIQEAEADLREFKRNMNLSRKVAGSRLHYPEVE
jgi:hypothetical protein